MPGHTKVLSVPYFAQPTDDTCQSTCLKMVATYIEQSVLKGTGAEKRDITGINEDINEGEDRPDKVQENSHVNMAWWLKRCFPSLRFDWMYTMDEARALESIVGVIDHGFPVIVGVSHANVKGHVILVVGYQNYLPNVSSLAFSLVVHDPYGRFDPWLRSKLFADRRFEGGMSLASGGTSGPGANTLLPITAAGRRRQGGVALGEYDVLLVRR